MHSAVAKQTNGTRSEVDTGMRERDERIPLETNCLDRLSLAAKRLLSEAKSGGDLNGDVANLGAVRQSIGRGDENHVERCRFSVSEEDSLVIEATHRNEPGLGVSRSGRAHRHH